MPGINCPTCGKPADYDSRPWCQRCWPDFPLPTHEHPYLFPRKSSHTRGRNP